MRGIAPALAALLLAASSPCAAAHNDTCASGLYMIVARGTTEPKGTGATGALAQRIAEQIKGSRVVPLDYPATFTDPAYDDSVADGVRAMQSAVNSYTKACPDAKLAIMGYSQGAHLSMDVLCGSGGSGFDDAQPLAMRTVKDNVVAVVLFGDPTHVANTTYDKGTSINNGIFERSNATVGVCQGYADRLVSYCDTGDVYCDAGEVKAVHMSYIERYGDDAVKFVVDRFKDAPKGANGTATHSAWGNGTATHSASANGTAMHTTSAGGSATHTTSAGGSATPTPTPTPTSSGTDQSGGSRGPPASGASGLGAARRSPLFLGAPLVILAVWQAL